MHLFQFETFKVKVALRNAIATLIESLYDRLSLWLKLAKFYVQSLKHFANVFFNELRLN